jgi:hypothetical protein
MKTRFTPAKHFLLLAMCVTWLGISPAWAQRTVFIPSSGANVGVLNEVIASDTLANGARTDSATVYKLERGGYYLLNGSIENRYPLTIMAADSAGDRPVLQPAVPSGGSASRAFRVRDDLTLKGLYITNLDNGGGQIDQILRCSADSIRLTIEDCHLDRAAQAGIRCDNPGMTIKIINSVFSNIGITSDPNNGRGIDDRGNDIDSLIVENSTFLNLTSTVLRDGGGLINYLWFNHNTVTNIGQRGMDAGQVTWFRLTNNLFANAGFLGRSPSADPDFANIIIIADSIAPGGPTQVIDVRNNNFWLDTTGIASVYPDTITAQPLYSTTVQAFVDAAGTGASNISENPMFTTGPASPVTVMTTWYADPGNTPAMDDGSASTVNQLPFDMTYSLTSASYTASLAGQPLGDLNWWDLDITGLEDRLLTQSAQLANYPNPFADQTTITYELKSAGNVRLAVFNMTGQQIAVLADGQQTAGNHEVTWHAGNQASGIYFYRLEVNNAVTTQKMVLTR